jgi:hypothetical protein
LRGLLQPTLAQLFAGAGAICSKSRVRIFKKQADFMRLALQQIA